MGHDRATSEEFYVYIHALTSGLASSFEQNQELGKMLLLLDVHLGNARHRNEMLVVDLQY